MISVNGMPKANFAAIKAKGYLNNKIQVIFLNNIYNMGGRSVLVCTGTSALHKHLCTLIQNGHKHRKLFIKQPQTVMFSKKLQKLMLKAYKIAIKFI